MPWLVPDSLAVLSRVSSAEILERGAVLTVLPAMLRVECMSFLSSHSRVGCTAWLVIETCSGWEMEQERLARFTGRRRLAMFLLCFNEHPLNAADVTPTAPELLAMPCTVPGLTGRKYEFPCHAFCFCGSSQVNGIVTLLIFVNKLAWHFHCRN